MYILGIETTGPHCSVAITDEKRNTEELVSGGTLNHLQNLTPMIREILVKCKLTLGDMTAVAVSAGPGSFTGTRIGVSTARCLGQVLNVGLIAVPTLKAFGSSLRQTGKIVCPVFDARRNQVYAGAYRDTEEIVPGAPYMLDEFLQEISAHDDFLFVGDGLAPYGDKIRDWAAGKDKTAVTELRYQNAAASAELGMDMYLTGGDEVLLSYEELKPNYMRMAEAERKLKEKTGSK